MVGVKTNIVTSVEVSDGYAHDYPYFKGLVDRTADIGRQGLSRCVEYAGSVATWRDPLHSIQK
jgi:hypothetical protein